MDNLVHKPLISVIVPYYNPRFDYFKEAIESVLSQSYNNWEIVIVNDCSSEQSKKSLEEYIKDLNEDRISIVHVRKNSGPAGAKNIGIRASKGGIVTFLDADDIHLPWCYEQIVENFNKNPSCLVLAADRLYHVDLFRFKRLCITKSFFNLLDEKESADEILHRIKSAKKALFNFLSLKAIVFKKIKFDSANIAGEDVDFCLQILNNGEILDKVALAPIVGYIYRLYPSKERITHKQKLVFDGIDKLINKYNDNKSLAYKMIKSFQTYRDEWRFNKLLTAYLSNGSILKHLKSAVLDSHSIKDKALSVRSLVTLYIFYNFLIPFFGIDFKCLNTLFDWRNDKYTKIKRMFSDYLSNQGNSLSTFYADRMFKRMFD